MRNIILLLLSIVIWFINASQSIKGYIWNKVESIGKYRQSFTDFVYDKTEYINWNYFPPERCVYHKFIGCKNLINKIIEILTNN